MSSHLRPKQRQTKTGRLHTEDSSTSACENIDIDITFADAPPMSVHTSLIAGTVSGMNAESNSSPRKREAGLSHTPHCDSGLPTPTATPKVVCSIPHRAKRNRTSYSETYMSTRRLSLRNQASQRTTSLAYPITKNSSQAKIRPKESFRTETDGGSNAMTWSTKIENNVNDEPSLGQLLHDMVFREDAKRGTQERKWDSIADGGKGHDLDEVAWQNIRARIRRIQMGRRKILAQYRSVKSDTTQVPYHHIPDDLLVSDEETKALVQERIVDPVFIHEVCDFDHHQNDNLFYEAKCDLLVRELVKEKAKNARLAGEMALLKQLALRVIDGDPDILSWNSRQEAFESLLYRMKDWRRD